MTEIKQVGGNHYDRFNYKLIDFIQDIHLPFACAEVLIYICRAPYKNGSQDIEKALSLLPGVDREWKEDSFFRDGVDNKIARTFCRFMALNYKALPSAAIAALAALLHVYLPHSNGKEELAKLIKAIPLPLDIAEARLAA